MDNEKNLENTEENVETADKVSAVEADEKEYVTFLTKTKDGREIEMAVVDEFECERKYYVASALIEGDTIDTNNLFIYRLKLKGSVDYDVEKITDPKEYERVAKAYLAME